MFKKKIWYLRIKDCTIFYPWNFLFDATNKGNIDLFLGKTCIYQSANTILDEVGAIKQP